MAENVIIRIREDGSLKVVRNFKNVGDSARRAEGGVNILRRALGLLGGVLAVRSVIQYADAFTQLQNRLQLVTKSTAEASVVTKELRNIANETRTAFANTGEFYARAALSARELGVSQRQLLNLTRSVNQAIILSGATAVEAEKGLIQFAQGIASGSLRGDELRSVLEQLPLVADVIAKQLGVTRGELRKIGATGAITSEVILEGFKNSREELERLFATTVPTIQQSFAVLRNEVVIFIGQLNQGSGASQLFNEVITALARNVSTFARLIAAGGIALAINGIRNAVVGLFSALAANPLGLIVSGATLAVGALVAFSDEITVAEGSLVTLQDVGVTAFTELVRATRQFVSDTIKGYQLINDGFKLLDFRSLAFGFARVIDVVTGAIDGLLNAVQDALFGIFEVGRLVGEGQFTAAKNRFLSIGQDIGSAITEGINQTTAVDAVDRIFDAANERATLRQIDANRRAQLEREVDLEQTGTRTLRPQTDDGKQKLTVDQVLAQLRQEGELLRLNNRDREVEAQLIRIITALKKAGAEFDIIDEKQIENLLVRNQNLQEQADLLQDIRGPQQDYRVQTEALNILLDEGRISLDEYNNKLAELNRTILETDNSASGAGKGLLAGFIQPAQSLFQSLEQTGIGTMQAFGDALGDTFRRGGNIGDFFQNLRGGLSDVLGQLAQLTFRLLLIQAITAAGGGGFLASIGVTSARAFGGTTQGGREGRVMRVGETGPENVFVGPGQQATVQPAQEQAPQENTFIAVADPEDVPRFINSTDGKNVMVQVVSRYRTEFRNALGV